MADTEVQHSCITCGQWLSNKFEDFCSGECWDIYYGLDGLEEV